MIRPSHGSIEGGFHLNPTPNHVTKISLASPTLSFDTLAVFGCLWMSGRRSDSARGLSGVFSLAAAIETTVTKTGRGRSVIRGKLRV
jgi:hypothetical protein